MSKPASHLYQTDSKTLTEIASRLRRMHETMCAAAATPPAPTIDPEVVCASNDGGITTIQAFVVFDTSTPVPTTSLYDFSGTLLVGYTIIPCQSEVDYDYETQPICVTNLNWTRILVFDPTNTTPTLVGVIWLDENNNVVAAPPVFTVGACNTSLNVYQRCLCDDVNGDGSLIVPFVQFYTYDHVNNVIAFTGSFTNDLSAPYVPVNAVDCETIGSVLTVSQQREHFNGVFVWNRPANTQSVTVKVRSVGNSVTPPTVTDQSGRVTPLYAGDSDTWSINDNENLFLNGGFTVTGNHPNDVITILYTQLI
jgi:hypothetical protein